MKFYFVFTRKFLFCIFCFLLIGVCFLSSYFDVLAATEKNGDTHKKRVDFLKTLNCEIYDEEAKQKEITIPMNFSDVYNNYNDLQKKSGYDLSKFKGEKCIIYSYKVKKFEPFGNDDFANANLIVYNGRIIGGDLSSAKIDGKMYPLKRYEKTKT